MDANTLTLNSESRQTLRQVAGLGMQRALLFAMGILAASLIPRRMGPQVYGQYSAMVTMSMWFSLMTGLGAVSLMTRFVPEFLARGDEHGLKKLASNLFALRLVNGLLAACAYLALAALWLKDLDRAAIALVAVSIALRTAANLPFTLFLGLNKAARWGASDLLRRILIFPFVFFGFITAGLRGAAAGLLLVEFSALALGLWWGRDYLSLHLMKIDRAFLHPFLRFSAAFFISNVLIMLFQQGGTMLVRAISGDYAEAGFYTIAFGAYLAGSQGVWKLLSAFGPLLSSLHTRNELDELEVWVGRLLKTLAIASVLTAALVYSHSTLIVSIMFGPGFEPVAGLLPVLALAGLTVAPSGVARLLAVTYKEPSSSITGAAIQLVSFAGLGFLLIPRLGSRGACWVVFVSVVLFACYSTWHMRRLLPYSLRRWLQVVGLGAVLSPLLWALPANWPGARVWGSVLFAAAFLAALAAFRIAGLRDLRALQLAFERVPAVPAGDPA